MDISFATRFENIVNITNAFVAKGKEVAEARHEAKSMEAEILKKAQSSEEYQQLCGELLDVVHPADTEVSELPEVTTADEILNQDGPSYGDFEHATFHRDGQMSTIFKAKARREISGRSIVALKVTVPARMEPPHNAQREARILVEAKHADVVPLLQSFWERDQFVLVFPFLRQDLENLLRTRTLTPKQSNLVYEGLFSALAHIHSLGIIHRDVKPSNILLKEMDGPVLLADFGIAWSARDPQSEPPNAKITDVGTTSYRPPELLFGDRSYNASLDMWSAGCVVAEIVRKDHHQLFDAGPLGSELGLIKSMFTKLGTPDDLSWPSASRLPDWGKMRFQTFHAQDWHDLLPGASDVGIDLVRQTVCYESTTRLTALGALGHPLTAWMRSRV